MNNKKGVSPVIATILLVGIVIVTGAAIFLWFNNMQQESITKFGETNIELICDEVTFDASYSLTTLYVSNTGNVPIYNFKVKVSEQGSYQMVDIVSLAPSWPTNGLNQGKSFSSQISVDSGAESIRLIPVLIGSSKSGDKSYVCKERNGYTLDV